MSSKDKKGKFMKILTIISGNADCGCANPKPTEVRQPKPISEIHKADPPPTIRRPSSPSSSSNFVDYVDDDEEEYSSITVDSSLSHCSRSPQPFRGGTIAVVKESGDPYRDFRRSMIQMMVAEDIWSEEDSKELLKCFLRLNSPLHHEIIIQAFTEIIRDGGANISYRQR